MKIISTNLKKLQEQILNGKTRGVQCPDDLPLYELASGDCQQIAKQLSCHQEIASDGCFSLGRVAHVEPTLHGMGVWMYPRFFWETGVLGQVLYLEAHAVGISATGIVHEVLGLRGSNFQSLYHFTVGGPVLDKRIMSLLAYLDLKFMHDFNTFAVLIHKILAFLIGCLGPS